MLIRVGKNGRINKPAEIRKKLKIETGDLLDIEVVDGTIILKPVPK